MGSELDHLEQKIAKLESEIFALRSELQQLRQKVKVGKQPVLANTMTTPVMLPPEAAPQQPAVRSQSWEWQIGGSMLGKIGVVTLILSAVLFTIYAFEQGWLSEWLRLLLLQIAGLAFALSSLQLHRRGYRHIPEVLNVAAFTANAIAIYSAHFIYGLISPGEAFGMVTTAMLLCLLLARRLHSPALVLLLLGAFFVLPAIHANVLSAPLAYFSYLVLVNLLYFMLRQTAVEALGAVGMHAFWIVVLGNTLSLGQWVGAHPHQILEPLIFITLYTAFFLWQGLRENWPQEQSKTLQLLAVLLTNFCSVALLFAILEKQRGLVPELRAMALLGVAALNVAVFAAAPRGKRRIEPIALVILILLSAAVFLLHEGNIQTLLLGLLVFPMLWAAARRGDTLLFACAVGLSFINFVLFLMRISLHGGIPFFNSQFAVFVCYVAAAMVLQRRSVWPITLNFSHAYATTAVVISFAGLWTELYRSTSNAELRLLLPTLLCSAYAAAFLFWGFRRQSLRLRQVGLAFVGLAIAKFYLFDIWQWEKWIRIVAGIMLGAALLMTSFYYEKFRGKFRNALAIAGLLLGLQWQPLAAAPTEDKLRTARFRFLKTLVILRDNGSKYGRATLDADIYRAGGNLLLLCDGKTVPYLRVAAKKAGYVYQKNTTTSALEVELKGDLAFYTFRNKEKLPFDELRLQFQEKDYRRVAKLYLLQAGFSGRELLAETTLERKDAKPEHHTLVFDATAGDLELELENGDNDALQMTAWILSHSKEYLIFPVPDGLRLHKKPLSLYYGEVDLGKKAPQYDIEKSAAEATQYAEFVLGEQRENLDYRRSWWDPPASQWVFRGAFWISSLLLLWYTWRVYRK